MTALKRFSEAYRQWRKLIGEATNLNSDASNQRRLTSKHVGAIWLVNAVIFPPAFWIALFIARREDLTWVMIEALSCAVAVSAPSLLGLVVVLAIRRIGSYIDGNPQMQGSSNLDYNARWDNWGAPPHTERVPWGLTMSTLVLASMTVGHISLWGLRSYVLPVLEGRELARYQMASPYVTFIPEVLGVWLIAIPLLRFLYSHRWQRRLDEEKLKREAAEHGQALAQAQLKLLQAQIEPHFLFNTLASVQHLVRKDPPRADFLLSQLIRYLREAMPDFRGMGSTLGREFGLAEAYLHIVRIRLDGRLEIKVTIPPELADISFPALIVQTLVENAIKHGIEPKPGPVNIYVTASETTVEGKQFVDVCVSDDGVGFGVAETMGTGVGLRNIRERLAGLYGPSARLDITNAMPSGVRATVRIPGRN